MKILIASSEKFSGCMIEALLRHGHQITGVLSPFKGVYERQHTGFRFRLNQFRGWDVQDSCRKHQLDFRVCANLEDGALRSFIRNKQPDLLLVFGWPGLISDEILSIFPHGGVNIHPSLLPELRGADPLFDIIDLNVNSFGVTFHQIVPELDAGPIYYQAASLYNARDTYDDLYHRILEDIRRHLPVAVRAIEKGAPPLPQKGEPTYVRKFRQKMRVLDPTDSYKVIKRRTLACYSHHARVTSIGDRLVYFTHCDRIEGYNSIREFKPGNIRKSGPFSMIIEVADCLMELRGIRFAGSSRWMTPYFLTTACKPGQSVGTRDTSLALLRNRRKEAQASSEDTRA